MGDAPRRVSVGVYTFVCSRFDVPVDRITLENPSPNVRLVRWGIDNSLSTTRNGSAHGGLEKLGVAFVGRSVERKCDDLAYSAIGLELLRGDDKPASLDGIHVLSRSLGQPKDLYIQGGWRVCSGATCPPQG